MTPNKKANQIAVKFYSKTPLDRIQSINCALIVVDEILTVLDAFYDNDFAEVKFWKEVKTELEAMK